MPLLRKSGGGKVLLMPVLAAPAAGVSIGTNPGNENISTEAGFYTAIEVNHTILGFETATLSPVGDTLEQTIVDTGTGKQGVLTSVMSPQSSASPSNMTIRVTADGKETVFTQVIDILNNSVMILGDTLPWAAQTSNTNSLSYGAGSHVSYFTVASAQDTVLVNPFDTLTRGLNVGIVFEDSLKVTVQCDANLRTGSGTHKAFASWLNYIPEGLL